MNYKLITFLALALLASCNNKVDNKVGKKCPACGAQAEGVRVEGGKGGPLQGILYHSPSPDEGYLARDHTWLDD